MATSSSTSWLGRSMVAVVVGATVAVAGGATVAVVADVGALLAASLGLEVPHADAASEIPSVTNAAVMAVVVFIFSLLALVTRLHICIASSPNHSRRDLSRVVTIVKMHYDRGMTSPVEPAQAPSRRDRVRAATIEEIKETATRMLREHGADLRFADIARDMGMTAPALYRYFNDRDELLSALMVDGFQEMSDVLTAALDATAPDDLAGRIRAAAIAYRDFAKADPSRFSLLFGLPNPGFGRHSEHSSGPAAGATMASLERLIQTVVEHGKLPTPLIRDVGPTWTNEAGRSAQRSDGMRIPADAYQALVHFLAAVHGFACLENFDHLNWISEQSRDELFDAEIELLILAMGATPPPSPPRRSGSA